MTPAKEPAGADWKPRLRFLYAVAIDRLRPALRRGPPAPDAPLGAVFTRAVGFMLDSMVAIEWEEAHLAERVQGDRRRDEIRFVLEKLAPLSEGKGKDLVKMFRRARDYEPAPLPPGRKADPGRVMDAARLAMAGALYRAFGSRYGEKEGADVVAALASIAARARHEHVRTRHGRMLREAKVMCAIIAHVRGVRGIGHKAPVGLLVRSALDMARQPDGKSINECALALAKEADALTEDDPRAKHQQPGWKGSGKTLVLDKQSKFAGLLPAADDYFEDVHRPTYSLPAGPIDDDDPESHPPLDDDKTDR